MAKRKKRGPRRGEGTPTGGPIRSLKRPMVPKKLTPEVLRRFGIMKICEMSVRS